MKDLVARVAKKQWIFVYKKILLLRDRHKRKLKEITQHSNQMRKNNPQPSSLIK